ncbi:MAG TPA: MFS transporter [Pirellulales bacterium]|jgi:MFS family permease|nr:MFS transporter [Pirellulales bacterium]
MQDSPSVLGSNPRRATKAASEITRLRELSPQQWKSGLAAWLGWLFDGLDMHLYTAVATPFVAELMLLPEGDPAVKTHSGWIQAAFLIGWALGGGFFGRIGDRLGRSRALMLTIFTYACFTGLSFFATAWWHLLICRFLAALGIGGEWAVGASLLSETWPRHWRPWMAATLQSAVNVGVLSAMACVALLDLIPNHSNRIVFLIGVLPALMVVWIRRAVPEPEEWHKARFAATREVPKPADLFRGPVRRITILTVLVCSLSLTAHWAFMFWAFQHLRSLATAAGWSPDAVGRVIPLALILVMISAIVGNYLGAALAKLFGGFRLAIAVLCFAYFLSLFGAYSRAWTIDQMWWWMIPLGASSGVFGLFTMYMPPLFPVLLRTTGAGFCYNIGRLAAAFGTIFFGLTDYRSALMYAGFLFIPAALFALMLPEATDETPDAEPVD